MDTDYVLGLLLERGQFNIARKYASIVNSTTSQVTLKEVRCVLDVINCVPFYPVCVILGRVQSQSIEAV